MGGVRSIKQQRVVIKARTSATGRRLQVTACAWSHDGAWIAGGCSDGSIQVRGAPGAFRPSSVRADRRRQLWKAGSMSRAAYMRPTLVVRNAHEDGCEITGLCFARSVGGRGGGPAAPSRAWAERDPVRGASASAWRPDLFASRATDGTLKLWDRGTLSATRVRASRCVGRPLGAADAPGARRRSRCACGAISTMRIAAPHASLGPATIGGC